MLSLKLVECSATIFRSVKHTPKWLNTGFKKNASQMPFASATKESLSVREGRKYTAQRSRWVSHLLSWIAHTRRR